MVAPSSSPGDVPTVLKAKAKSHTGQSAGGVLALAARPAFGRRFRYRITPGSQVVSDGAR